MQDLQKGEALPLLLRPRRVWRLFLDLDLEVILGFLREKRVFLDESLRLFQSGCQCEA